MRSTDHAKTDLILHSGVRHACTRGKPVPDVWPGERTTEGSHNLPLARPPDAIEPHECQLSERGRADTDARRLQPGSVPRFAIRQGRVQAFAGSLRSAVRL